MLKFLKIFGIILFVFLTFVGCASLEQNKKEKIIKRVSDNPNILIILPDQLRRYSAGFWTEDYYKKSVVGKSDPVVTPTIDRLAKNGVVFTNGISNFPLCSPYRGMLMSGMYPEQNGIWNNCRIGRNESLRDDIATITDLFYKAGYNTSYFGKLHWLKPEPLFDENGNYIGTADEPGGHYVNQYDTYVPPGKARHSIEYFYQSLKDSHKNPLTYSNDPKAVNGKKDGELYQPKQFSSKIEAEKIIEYLQNKNNVRDTNKPFCMMWSLNPPHSPWEDQHTEMDVLKAHYDTDKYPTIASLVLRENAQTEKAKHVRHYFAHVTSVDNYIGKVLEALERQGVLDNTIVVFTSDHGEMLGSHGLKSKNVIKTEALAIPLIIHWPKGIKSGINGILFGAPDILPTLMGLAGLEKNIPKEVQGINFAELIKDQSTKNIQKPESILLMLNSARGIMTERYILSVEEDKEGVSTYIYDNLKDPYQFVKLPLDDHPKLSERLLKELASQLKKTNDPWFKHKEHAELIPY
ncbi:sulfatase [Tamlana sp. 2201CG12-4]|uniref:sulfatase family protein n=1 Tax=Tamlana sp. 2201CG12-4 TaxID=3112582 RepID=UPI002DBAB5F0|nr:sulfatase [Tamlana sp. 2201CG12-4]MEC3907172.1 sulfatase [Tamlana sp. 2201CG12-4]